jgi:hypothetical protein
MKIVFGNISVVHTYMPSSGISSQLYRFLQVCSITLKYLHEKSTGNLPLEVVRSRVFVFSVWAKWAYVTRTLMNQSVTNHFDLPLKPFTAFSAWASCNWAVIRSAL